MQTNRCRNVCSPSGSTDVIGLSKIKPICLFPVVPTTSETITQAPRESLRVYMLLFENVDQSSTGAN